MLSSFGFTAIFFKIQVYSRGVIWSQPYAGVPHINLFSKLYSKRTVDHAINVLQRNRSNTKYSIKRIAPMFFEDQVCRLIVFHVFILMKKPTFLVHLQFNANVTNKCGTKWYAKPSCLSLCNLSHISNLNFDKVSGCTKTTSKIWFS